jgi:fatty-acid desaturase
VYLVRFMMLPALGLVFLAGFLVGGDWLSASLIIMLLLATIVEETVPDDRSTPDGVTEYLAFALPLLHLPILIVATVLAAYYISDWTFLGATMNDARASTNAAQLFGLFVSLGFYYGIAGINIGHELIHRRNRFSVLAGRWLLSFAIDPGFIVEHIHNHHRYVGTSKDPATAPRGMGFWTFLIRMLIEGNRSAWAIEKQLLERKGEWRFSLSNRIVSGLLMSLVWAATFAAADGARGFAIYLGTALIGKTYLEVTNYIEHYGIVRIPGRPVEPRHSWNSNRSISSWVLFNLPRHSHHHVSPQQRYWELKPLPEAPFLPFGYFTMALCAFVPPLFRHVMSQSLESWDRDYASAEEQALLKCAT